MTRQRRRRGEALEHAILSGAWDELSEKGYPNFTMDAVATRVGTSRPVLARRWKSRAELAIAALAFYMAEHPVTVEPSGNVRDDLAILLQRMSQRGARTGSILFSMRSYFEETGSTMLDFRKRLERELRPTLDGEHPYDQILRRGVASGELDARKLTKRIAALPADLIRHETLMTQRPVSKQVVLEILDSMFLPLVRAKG